MDRHAGVDDRRPRGPLRLAAAAATKSEKKNERGAPSMWPPSERAGNLGGREGGKAIVPISGLVITLDGDASEETLRALCKDARITLGECRENRLPAVTETPSAAEAEELLSTLFRVPGIAFVDVVCIDSSLDLDLGYSGAADAEATRDVDARDDVEGTPSACDSAEPTPSRKVPHEQA